MSGRIVCLLRVSSLQDSVPKIPIENIYYLFCFAWKRFETARSIGLGAETSPDLPNLFSKVLLAGSRTLISRGLDRGYCGVDEDIATIRGQVDFNASLLLKARHTPRLTCNFDELKHDVLHNQILKATILKLARTQSVVSSLRSDLRRLALKLSDVSDIRLTSSTFLRVKLNRNNAYYDLLLKICRLAHECLLPSSNGTGFAFSEILRDEKKMALVFEDFVKNFFATSQSEFKVKPLQFKWDAIPVSEQQEGRLPSMITDIFLKSPDRDIIIDTKYYASALQSNFGSQSFKSENIYQIFAYLKNGAASGKVRSDVEGMLLYPNTGKHLSASYTVQGHKITLATINLDQPWQAIEYDLLRLIYQ